MDTPRRLVVDLGTIWIMPTTAGPFEVACGRTVFISERPEREALRAGRKLLAGQAREKTR